MTKKGIAMVEMKNSRGADNVLNHLNRAKVLGSQISVSVTLPECSSFHRSFFIDELCFKNFKVQIARVIFNEDRNKWNHCCKKNDMHAEPHHGYIYK